MYVETLNSDAADNRFYCITIIGIFSGTSSDIKKKCIFEHCKINNINKFPLYIIISSGAANNVKEPQQICIQMGSSKPN